VGNQGALRIVLVSLTIGELSVLRIALLKDLDDHLVVNAGTELVLQRGLGGCVVGALVALLVRDEDLVGGDEVGQRDRLVRLPLLEQLGILNEDDEVVLLALVVDLGLVGLAANHFGG